MQVAGVSALGEIQDPSPRTEEGRAQIAGPPQQWGL